MIQGSINQEDITVLNMHVPNNRVSNTWVKTDTTAGRNTQICTPKGTDWVTLPVVSWASWPLLPTLFPASQQRSLELCFPETPFICEVCQVEALPGDLEGWRKTDYYSQGTVPADVWAKASVWVSSSISQALWVTLSSRRLRERLQTLSDTVAARQALENLSCQDCREMVSAGFSGFSSPVVAVVT